MDIGIMNGNGDVVGGAHSLPGAPGGAPALTVKVEKHKGAVGSLLVREDFDSGPVSVNIIEEGLYLGNLKAACDLNTLNRLKISHILTVDSVPLPRVVTERMQITNKYVQVTDVTKEDLISHFVETNEFIRRGQEQGIVLVHCYFGMSRSAAIVIAYLMAKHQLQFEEALYFVKAKRSLSSPNSGFLAQLKLYGKMNCILDKEHPKYKQFRLKMAAESVKKVKILPQMCSDLVKPDPGLTQERPDPHVYRCRKCRRIVASQKNIIPHIPKSVRAALSRRVTIKKGNKEEASKKCDVTCAQNGQILIEKLKSLACGSDEADIREMESDTKKLSDSDETIGEIHVAQPEGDAMGTGNIADSSDSPEICRQTYFIEPLAWMRDVQRNVQGKLHCPKCTNKLGSFSWIMGCQCPCGAKVAPAFYLVPSKVEWSTVVQNVQVTV